ncbi:MAG TPA: hypothetical protein VJG65_01065 [Patescibacteria group bacterium]|nr:hypothetical protein [Patescibacteria group bacterium]
MAQNQNPDKLGALWVNEPKNERGPVLTGEINGVRVVAFKNQRWSEADQKKQPLYHILKSTPKGKD